MRFVLHLLDLFFLILHGGVVLFLLTAWIWPPLRRAHRWLVGLTTLSWFVLGFWFGIGYCFLTDWHWRVLGLLGRRDLPASFIKYAVDGMTGGDWNPLLIDVCTAAGFCLALGAAIWTGWRERGAPAQNVLDQNGDAAQEKRKPSGDDLSRVAMGLLVITAAVVGLGRAIAWRWTADDAYISFRYALNWSRGLGPVFNEGERVEGYTNFLWTLLLTIAAVFDLSLEAVANALSILCYLFLFGAIIYGGRYLVHDMGTTTGDAPASGTAPKNKTLRNYFEHWIALLPWSVPALLLHKHQSVYATSGLETQLFTLLVTAGFLMLMRARGSERPNYIPALTVLACACLTRPDGLLLYGIASLWIAGATLRSPAGKRIAAYLMPQLPFLLLYVPYWIARYTYYGLPWPNTFYAKSAADPYLSQGLTYLGLYFGSYWILPLLFVLAAVGLLRRRTLPATNLLIGLSAIGAWCAYLAFVGGDFMFARFLIPITPLLFLTGEGLMRQIFADRFSNEGTALFSQTAVAMIVSTTLALAVLLRYDPFAGRPLPLVAGISEEHVIYSRTNRIPFKAEALRLKATIQAADPVIAFYGSQAALIYYWDVSRAIEAETGLTDRLIAARKIEKRGRVGHEKQSSRAELRRRGVDWSLRPPPPGQEGARLRAGSLGDFEILCFRPRVMGQIDSGVGLVFESIEPGPESDRSPDGCAAARGTLNSE